MKPPEEVQRDLVRLSGIRFTFRRPTIQGKILDLVEQPEPAMVATLRAAAGLTPFGVEVRYPGDAPELLPGEEAGVIEIACRVRDAVIGLLRHYLSVQA